MGCYCSINIGIKASKGKYITLLGSDDIFVSTKLSKQVRKLDNNKNLICVACYYKRGDKIMKNVHSTLMFRKRVIRKIGYYDSVRFGGDSEYLRRIIRIYKKKRVHIIKQCLYLARNRINSLTNNPSTKRGGIIRQTYIKRFKQWHKKNNTLYMSYPLIKRSFKVHQLMLP